MRKELIIDYIDEIVKDNSKGIFIVSAPTGYGKTYQILEYIRRNYKTKKIFFISNQEKLISPLIDELTKSLNEVEANELLKQTIQLKSIYNTYLDCFLEIEIDAEFYDYETTEILNSIRGIIRSLKTKNSDTEVNEILMERFYTEEKRLRKLIKRYLDKNRSIPKWISKLYPSIILDKYNVVFMTTKKFFLPIDPLNKKSYFLYEKKYENSVLFIDEIDSTKPEILDIIINDKSNEKIELFRLFRNVNKAILDLSMINDFPVDEEGNLTYGYNFLEEVRRAFVEKKEYVKVISGNSYKDSNALDFAFKSDEFNTNNNFLFNDGSNITILGNRSKSFLEFSYNKDKVRNEIIIASKKNRNNLEAIFEVVLESINIFVSKTARLVLEYKKNYERINNEIIEVSDIYASIIDRMNLGEENKNYLLSSIHEYMSKRKTKLDNIQSDLNINYHLKKNDFYYRGFSYLEIVDSIDHHLESKLYTYNYNKTPEYYLISLAQNYHVIGLSATATINSAITNYDLGYVKFVLKDSYKELSKLQQEEIQKDYDTIRKKSYEKTSIEVDNIDSILINKCSNNKKRYLEIVLDNDINYHSHIESANKSDLQDYHLEKCANLYQVLERFMNNEKMHSFIYFINSNMNNWGLLKDKIESTIKTKYDNKLDFIILDANFYKNNDLNSIFEKSKKVFVVSAYNTVGIGINLQYGANEENIELKKDFDGVFLSSPTNIMPNLNSEILSKNDLAKFIYALEYSKIRDSISYNMHKQAIKYAFDRYIHKDSKLPFKYVDNDEIGLGKVKIIMQAIGRISRTNYQRKHIQIFTTHSVCKLLAKYHKEYESLPMTFEFKELINFVRKNFSLEESFVSLNNITNIMRKSNEMISSFIKPWNWTNERIIGWNELRDIVLKNPTSNDSSSDIISNTYLKFKIPISEYSIDNMYRLKKISNNSSVYRISVSEYASNLKMAMQFDYIKEKFISRKYATEFVPGEYIISPLLFKKIYIAAIGEKVGEFILNEHGITLSEITDHDLYELFDYHFKNEIYIDFKNWQFDFELDKYEQVKKIISKNKKAKSKYIFVINVFYQGHSKINEFIQENVKIITIPWLIGPNNNVNKKGLSKIIEKVSIWQ